MDAIRDRKAIIIPGAGKSGTTTLFSMLSKHSAIDRPKLKEPQFFALDKETILENLSWYENLFSNDREKILLDASTFYFFSERAPYLIKEFFKHPKIVIILRDPVRRAYSAWMHVHKPVPSADERSFDAILEEMEGPGRDRIVLTENESLRKAIQRGKINVNHLGEDYLSRVYDAAFKSRFEDKLWLYKHFQGSLYSSKVRNYEELFGKDVKVIFLEELILDPEAVIADVLNFIGIEPEDQVLELPHVNKTVAPRKGVARKLLELEKSNRLVHNVSRAFDSMSREVSWRLNQKLRQLTRKCLYKVQPRLSREQYSRGREILREEYEFWFSRYDQLEKLWKY